MKNAKKSEKIEGLFPIKFGEIIYTQTSSSNRNQTKMNNTNTDVNPLTIYSEQYQEMAYTLPRGPRLRISDSVEARFREWVTANHFNSYRMCQVNCKHDPHIHTMILNHIFTPNMKTVWTLSEPYVGKRSTDIKIIQARETQKTLKNIMNYIKEKLCKIVFEEEARITNQTNRIFNQVLREINLHDTNMQVIRRPNSTEIRYVPAPLPPFVYEIKRYARNITEEEANKEMEDDCAICASKHKMIDIYSLTCRHQFGIECLTPWINTLKNARKPPTCPCCRTKIKKILKNCITPSVL